MTMVATAVAAGLALYLLVLLVLALGQRSLLYFPNRHRTDPAQVSPAPITEHVIAASDGAQLITWYLEPAPGRPTVLYFHGNGGGLIDRADRFARFQAAGLGLMMPSYRGYSGSTGRPSEAAIMADAQLVWDTLRAFGAAPAEIVLYGESLGTGVATQLAAQVAPRALILEAPYSSIADVAAWRFPAVPVRRLLRDRFESTAHIGKVQVPIMIIHGELDGIVPIRFGRKLFAVAPGGSARFISYPHGGHSDLYSQGAFEEVVGFLDAVPAGASLRARLG